MSESKTNWIAALRNSVIGPQTERRIEPRKYVKLPIEVKVESGATYPGFSRDLSRSSMAAVVSTPLKIGQEVSISFKYPRDGDESARAVVLEASVRQCLGYRYCFQFHLPFDF